jgi:hypothetical protein
MIIYKYTSIDIDTLKPFDPLPKKWRAPSFVDQMCSLCPSYCKLKWCWLTARSKSNHVIVRRSSQRTYDARPLVNTGFISMGRPFASLAFEKRSVAKVCTTAAHNTFSAKNRPGHTLWAVQRGANHITKQYTFFRTRRYDSLPSLQSARARLSEEGAVLGRTDQG